MPIPRFRIRTLMIAVAVVAGVLAVGSWLASLGMGNVLVLAGLVLAALGLGAVPGLALWWADASTKRRTPPV